MAEEIKKGIATTDASIEVGLFPITELTNYNEDNIAFVNDSAAVIVGTPDYYAAEANQLKTWLDTCPCKLADKLCGAYATANFLQGGADIAIQSVLTQILVKGALVYSSGTAQGLPFIHLGPVCLKGQEEAAAELFQTYGARFAAKTKELFA
jgi:NAD(P)H dehydrogenase (quinone)